MPDETVIIYTDSNAQDLTDQIKAGGRPVDLTGANVIFRMRYADSDQTKVDANASVTTASTGMVSYDWTDTDIDTPGEYFGWWHIILAPGQEIDTSEFPIIVAAHAPGLRTRTGTIYRQLLTKLPITITALRDYSEFGDSRIQEIIEEVKLRLLGDNTVTPVNEKTLDIRVQTYLAKLAALEIIPSGVDYWASQHISVTTGGGTTNEIATFPDRIAALWKIYERYLIEVKQDAILIDEILGSTGAVTPSTARPEVVDAVDEGFVTPSPNKNFRDYAFPGKRSGRWNWWLNGF